MFCPVIGLNNNNYLFTGISQNLNFSASLNFTIIFDYLLIAGAPSRPAAVVRSKIDARQITDVTLTAAINTIQFPCVM